MLGPQLEAASCYVVLQLLHTAGPKQGCGNSRTCANPCECDLRSRTPRLLCDGLHLGQDVPIALRELSVAKWIRSTQATLSRGFPRLNFARPMAWFYLFLLVVLIAGARFIPRLFRECSGQS
jgi:hypothetical protein